MSASPAIEVVVSADAEDRISDLGLSRAFESILEYTKQIIPDLEAIEVVPFFDDPFAPHLLILPYRADVKLRSKESGKIQDQWFAWVNERFPPEVATWFLLDVCW